MEGILEDDNRMQERLHRYACSLFSSNAIECLGKSSSLHSINQYTIKYICVRTNYGAMPKTTLTLSEPVAKALKIYTVQTKSSMRAQSQVIEEALREFFQNRGIEIEE